MSFARLVALVLVLVVLLVVVALLLRAAPPADAGRLRGAAAVVVAAVGAIWMLVNGPVEGYVLLSVTRTHGLTVADLPSVALFVASAVIARPRRRRAVATRVVQVPVEAPAAAR